MLSLSYLITKPPRQSISLHPLPATFSSFPPNLVIVEDNLSVSILSLSTPSATHSNLGFTHCCNCSCKIFNDLYHPGPLGLPQVFILLGFADHSTVALSSLLQTLLGFYGTPLLRFSHLSVLLTHQFLLSALLFLPKH